jgi:hypothetical protein
MPPEPVPADPGWDEDLAWLDRDPERETWLDRALEHDLIITIDPITTDPCDHRFESQGHDPGVKLRHLAQVRHATCTSPICRRPAAHADFEHNMPYEAGGRTCLCNGGPPCQR